MPENVYKRWKLATVLLPEYWEIEVMVLLAVTFSSAWLITVPPLITMLAALVILIVLATVSVPPQITQRPLLSWGCRRQNKRIRRPRSCRC